MLDIIIYIKSDGENATPDSLTKTVSSIEATIGSVNYKYYFVLNKTQEATIMGLIASGIIDKDKIVKIKRSKASWASEYNLFFDECKDLTKYILTSHDDLIIRTKDFFNISVSMMKGKEKDIGWATFTCDTYYRDFGRPWGVSARYGFAKDRHKWPFIYECHKFDASYNGRAKENLHLLDMPGPGKLVKIHSPYSVLNLVSVEAMKKIGYCEDWTLYTIMIDEDWGLEALRNNLCNVWITDIYYTHPLKEHPNRWEKEGHEGFVKKWGFDHSGDRPTPEEIEEIKQEYKDTLIPWSAYYNTYDWQYL